MKKTIALISILFSAVALVACNSGSTNASDVSSSGASNVTKAVCTSSNNWQSVGIGMSASQVEERLGKPASITADAASTQYLYERCRGGNFLKTEATDATATEPAKPAVYQTTYFGGSVTISASRGVTQVTPPALSSDAAMACEWDFYNYPTNYGGGGTFVCRTPSNPF